MLLSAQNIEKYYGEKLIFKFNNFKVYKGDKIGIVGNNGSGKSTLLKILAGILQPDCGNVDIKCQVSYVDQLAQQSHDADNIYSSMFGIKNQSISGGEVMRKKLAAALSAKHDILLLDEPTSNLDIEGINILNAALIGEETFLIISHDKTFLNNHCNKILEVEKGKINIYNGGYSDYEQIKKEEKYREEFLFNEYKREKDKLEKAIQNVNYKASKVKKTPARMGNSEARLHKREATAKQAKIYQAGSGLATRLQKLEEAKRPQYEHKINIEFGLTNPPRNKVIVSCDDLNFEYENNIIFKNAKFLVNNGEHIAIVGSNGSGKSTLLKLILNSENFYKVPKVKIGYMSQNFLNLNFNQSILQNVLDTAVQNQTVCRNVLAGMGFWGDDVHKNVSVVSGGELIKISLAKLIASDCNVILLDEPTNYLDIMSLKQVKDAIKNYEGTLIFVSHDKSFINDTADIIFKIEDKKIIECSNI